MDDHIGLDGEPAAPRHVAADASQKAKRLPDELLRALALYVVVSSES